MLLEPYGEWAGLASVYLLAGFGRGLVPLPRCSLPPELHVVDDPAAAVAELLAEQARARRLDRADRRSHRSATPTSAPPSSSPTGARSRSGGATSGASLPTTSARTTGSRRRRCSTGSRCRPRDDAPHPRRARRPAAPPTSTTQRSTGVELDLLLLGLGSDGHMASLFPGSPQLEVERPPRDRAGPPGSSRSSTA